MVHAMRGHGNGTATAQPHHRVRRPTAPEGRAHTWLQPRTIRGSCRSGQQQQCTTNALCRGAEGLTSNAARCGRRHVAAAMLCRSDQATARTRGAGQNSVSSRLAELHDGASVVGDTRPQVGALLAHGARDGGALHLALGVDDNTGVVCAKHNTALVNTSVAAPQLRCKPRTRCPCYAPSK